jgi:hypothetical protein
VTSFHHQPEAQHPNLLQLSTSRRPITPSFGVKSGHQPDLVVLCLRRENPLRTLDPKDAARRNTSRSAIRSSWWHGSLNSVDAGRNVADKGNGNRRNREAEELLQIDVPTFEATKRHGLSSRSDSSSHLGASIVAARNGTIP